VVATFAAATFAFLCIQLAPGDPVTALGEGVPEAVRERLRAVYGYDAPMAAQYLRWLGALAGGDFGWSTAQQRPALDVVLDALGNSLVLVVPAVAIATVLGAAIGAWQGIHARSRRDRIASTVLFTLYALPEFSLGLLLLILFSVAWPILPSGGMVGDLHRYLSPTAQLLDRLRHLLLPMLVIAIVDTAALARYQRQSMRDALDQPFVQAAHGAGLPGRRVYWQAWRASLLPVLTLLGILLPVNLLGVVFVEQTFAWPGLGLTFYNAINGRDYAVVAACVVVQGAIIALSTFAIALLREAVDPRLRESEAGRARGAAAW
jgi:peptide/nickel transport system permease protein